MTLIDILRISVAFTIPLSLVSGLFFWVMSATFSISFMGIESSIGRIQRDLEATRRSVRSIDVRLARLEERIPPRE